MLTVRFFSMIREALNRGELVLEWHEDMTTVNAVKEHLVAMNGEDWREVLFQPNVVHAVNQKVVFPDSAVQAGDEVAFFPPMTGG